jgi:hypothetical protein
MVENNLDNLLRRKDQLEQSILNLNEIIQIRGSLLSYYERHIINKVTCLEFTHLNPSTNGYSLKNLNAKKKNYEIDAKMLRRCMFYLHKRKRYMREELDEIEQQLMIQNPPVESVDPLQSTETPPDT